MATPRPDAVDHAATCDSPTTAAVSTVRTTRGSCASFPREKRTPAPLAFGARCRLRPSTSAEACSHTTSATRTVKPAFNGGQRVRPTQLPRPLAAGQSARKERYRMPLQHANERCRGHDRAARARRGAPASVATERHCAAAPCQRATSLLLEARRAAPLLRRRAWRNAHGSIAGRDGRSLWCGAVGVRRQRRIRWRYVASSAVLLPTFASLHKSSTARCLECSSRLPRPHRWHCSPHGHVVAVQNGEVALVAHHQAVRRLAVRRRGLTVALVEVVPHGDDAITARLQDICTVLGIGAVNRLAGPTPARRCSQTEGGGCNRAPDLRRVDKAA